MASYFIIGGTGSLGRKLIDRLLPDHNVAVYSRDEAKHYTIRNELSQHPQFSRLQFVVGDVRDKGRLQDSFRQVSPDTVIIAAALKQVDTCELSPNESVQTNLVGTQNVVDVVNTTPLGVPTTVLFVSTDKACAPVNVYGMCKAVSERIVTSQARNGRGGVRFLATRYGNVLESRGSIVPLFKYQGEHNDHLTVTDPDMTRFLMTLDESVDLIQHTLQHGTSGDVWVPRLPAMRVGDLALIFSRRYGKPIKVIGLRPGEKQDEDLINESESVRTDPDGDKHYVIQPAYRPPSHRYPFVYSSKQDVMRIDQLEAYLQERGILDAPLASFKGASIEEIVTQRQ